MNAPILPESTKPLPSLSDSELDRWLVQADIFAEIFRRETVRARYGSQNQVPQAIRQLRACLDKLDELQGEEHHDEQ